ncbi:hypothetical protein GCM10010404_93680 [Nonomuraea africana]
MDADTLATIVAALAAVAALYFSATSARAARKSAEEARTTVQMEQDRRHEELAPLRPSDFKVEHVRGRGAAGIREKDTAV